MDSDQWLQILDENGPLTVEEFDDVAAAHEWDYESPLPPDVLEIADELFVRKSWLQDRVVTHRLTQVEAESGVVDVIPDWLAIMELTDGAHDVSLADGGLLHIVDLWTEAPREIPDALAEAEYLFVFSADYFTARGLGAGDLVGLRVDASGVASVEAVVATGKALVLDIDQAGPTEVSFVMWTLACDGLLDEPRLPVSEIATNQGLHVRGDGIYPADYPFARRWFEHYSKLLFHRYVCDDDAEPTACAVLATLLKFPQATLEDLGVSAEQFRGSLSLWFGARIIGWEMLRLDFDPQEMVETARSMGPFSGDAALSLRFLDALLAEYLGDVESAVAQMRQIFAEDPAWPPAITELAGYAQAAGDPQRAADLLELLEGTEQQVAKLRSFLGSGTHVGRNDRCPCGSGRKYKQCHLGRPMLDAGRRADWIASSALQYGYEVVPGRVERLAFLLEPRVADDSKASALIRDVALMEFGLLDMYRSTRGPLMPDEDRDFIDGWLYGPPRTLVEVLDNTLGAVRVRDVATGDEVVVSERSAAPSMKPGTFWVTRVSPVGQEQQFFGGVYPVMLNQREVVLGLLASQHEIDIARLIALLVHNLDPPVLQTTSGEDLVLGTAVVKVRGDLGALNAVFDQVGKNWLLKVGDSVQASVSRAGNNLKVESMSKERLEAALALVLQALPGSEVLDVTYKRPPAPGSIPRGKVTPPKLSADEREAVTAYVAKYERDWLDMDIPALDGLTPRQAAADPTRRDDLIRLLATFPETDDPTQMSPARLRAMLGL